MGGEEAAPEETQPEWTDSTHGMFKLYVQSDSNN